MQEERKDAAAPDPVRVQRILALIDREYGTDIRTFLDYEPGETWQLLVAVILSAQCTDARVNEVTKTLFVKYPDLPSLAAADLGELEREIFSTGFYHNKAKNIKACAEVLLRDYGGEVPSEIDELVKLPGVGRKTANVIRGNVYGTPSIVVDTHVKRIAKRLGFTNETDPVKVEFDLMRVLPEDHWILVNLQLITLGRQICRSQSPDCAHCFLSGECRGAEKKTAARKAAGGETA